jgi:phosphoribosylformimino-5-aminoimidazole carboxamide ribotide isomerase
MSFIVIPAIDLKEGKCVRLEQGLMERDTVFCENPAEQAREWAGQGAELLHIVDLDGAFAGVPKNKEAITAIVNSIPIPTQLGGGIRDLPTIEAYLVLGVGRVILGTAAQRNPELVMEACRLFPGRIVVGIDAKNGMVAVKGWAEVTDARAVDLARRFEGYGVAAIIYTDISRDGMMAGPNIEATKALAEAVSIPVIASGGVSSLADIENLMTVETFGVSGVITGRAIYTGAFKLAEAIALTKKQTSD